MAGLVENQEDLDELTHGINLLIYGMIGWLSFVTVITVIIFTAVTIKLSRTAHQLDEIEFGSSSSSQSSAGSTKQQKRRPRPLGSNDVLRNRRRQQQQAQRAASKAACRDDVTSAAGMRGVSSCAPGDGLGAWPGGASGPGSGENGVPLSVT